MFAARRVLKSVEICKSVPARREAKRIRAAFTNNVSPSRIKNEYPEGHDVNECWEFTGNCGKYLCDVRNA